MTEEDYFQRIKSKLAASQNFSPRSDSQPSSKRGSGPVDNVTFSPPSLREQYHEMLKDLGHPSLQESQVLEEEKKHHRVLGSRDDLTQPLQSDYLLKDSRTFVGQSSENVEASTTAADNQADNIFNRIQNLRKKLMDSHQERLMESTEQIELPKTLDPFHHNQTFAPVGQSSHGSTYQHYQPIRTVERQSPDTKGSQELNAQFRSYDSGVDDLRQNLSPKLLSTRKDGYGCSAGQRPDTDLYYEQIRRPCNHALKDNPDRSQSPQYIIPPVYEERMQELEKKAAYLDRSLDLIEEMRGKFVEIEQQNRNYNELMQKYSSLLNRVQGHDPTIGSVLPTSMTIQDNDVMQQRIRDLEQEVQRRDYENKSLKDANYHLAVSPNDNFQITNLRIPNRKPRFQDKENIRPNRTSNQRSFSQKRQSVSAKKQRHKSPFVVVSTSSKRRPNSGDKIRNKSADFRVAYGQTKLTRQQRRPLSARRPQEKAPLYKGGKRTSPNVDHLRIKQLEKENRQLKQDLQKTQERLVSNKNLMCCCEDLKQIYQEKYHSIESIADSWKQKTKMLVEKYYSSLQLVREDHNRLTYTTQDQLEKLKTFQQTMLNEILAKTEEMAYYYENRLRQSEKERKDLRKRLIEKRYAKGKKNK